MQLYSLQRFDRKNDGTDIIKDHVQVSTIVFEAARKPLRAFGIILTPLTSEKHRLMLEAVRVHTMSPRENMKANERILHPYRPYLQQPPLIEVSITQGTFTTMYTSAARAS